MKKYISFDKMITPAFIKIVFWLGVALSVLIGLGIIGSGLSSGGNEHNVFVGLLILVIGPIIVRIYCEVIMIAFKIVETLDKINDKLDDI